MAGSKMDKDNDTNEDRGKCPLCGEPNQCALAADPAARECWCDAVVFPAELLAKIPREAVRKTCVCQSCLKEYLESSNASQVG
jgi:hypothetical protein